MFGVPMGMRRMPIIVVISICLQFTELWIGVRRDWKAYKEVIPSLLRRKFAAFLDEASEL